MVKIALVGCGGWGKNIARTLSAIGALKCIIDPADHAVSLADELHVKHSRNLEDALDDEEIRGVAIATPAHTHFEVAQLALGAKKHTYIEKPISLSVADGELLNMLALEAGRVLMVGHLMQYHPAFRTLLALKSRGALGKVCFISSNRLNFGLLRSEEDVAWSFAPHDISMVLALAERKPKRVQATGHAVLQKGIADIATIQLDFGDGLLSEIRASWLHPEKEQKLIVVGDQAMAIFSDREPWPEKLKLHHNRVLWNGGRPVAVAGAVEKIELKEESPLKAEMQHFIDCIDNNRVPITNAEEANMVLAVLEAARSSMNTGSAWISTSA